MAQCRRRLARDSGGAVTRRRALWARVLLVGLALSAVQPGLWALFAPRSFHATFPGRGLHWVADLGPYDEHLVRDVGAFYLALALLSGLAARSLHVELVRAAAGAWLVFQVPHLLQHLHLAPDWSPGTLLQITVLAAQLVAALVTAAATRTALPLRRTSAGGPAGDNQSI